jgi:Na+-transporting methylmalonyl-CoA/oxaloacetate decarboxylase gamma subunit
MRLPGEEDHRRAMQYAGRATAIGLGVVFGFLLLLAVLRG